MSTTIPTGLLPLPESRFCAWVLNGTVVNAFTHGAGKRAEWDRDGYWAEKGYDRSPLFTADQMYTYAEQKTTALSARVAELEIDRLLTDPPYGKPDLYVRLHNGLSAELDLAVEQGKVTEWARAAHSLIDFLIREKHAAIEAQKGTV